MSKLMNLILTGATIAAQLAPASPVQAKAPHTTHAHARPSADAGMAGITCSRSINWPGGNTPRKPPPGKA